MHDRTLPRTGIIGMVVAALCRFTPVLAARQPQHEHLRKSTFPTAAPRTGAPATTSR
jgi:hypothetical protein